MEPHLLTESELRNGLDDIRLSPVDSGIVSMIVLRPGKDLRELPDYGEVTPEAGLVGDRWAGSCTRYLPDGRKNPDTQLTLMNMRVVALMAGERERWPLAGDNFFVDLDLSQENLPVGQRLRIGGAVVEISAEPHNGCAKFLRRFGDAALKFVNSPEGRSMRLRGVNAMVIQPGRIHIGDRIEKIGVSPK